MQTITRKIVNRRNNQKFFGFPSIIYNFPQYFNINIMLMKEQVFQSNYEISFLLKKQRVLQLLKTEKSNVEK